ncbi:hypothetical protein SALBM217S_05450 [Streptomyces griseoloalbus]
MREALPAQRRLPSTMIPTCRARQAHQGGGEPTFVHRFDGPSEKQGEQRHDLLLDGIWHGTADVDGRYQRLRSVARVRPGPGLPEAGPARAGTIEPATDAPCAKRGTTWTTVPACGTPLAAALDRLPVPRILRRAVGAARAMSGTRRLEWLNAAGYYIGTTLDLDRTAQELADYAVPELADATAVDLLESILCGGEGERSGSADAPLTRAMAVAPLSTSSVDLRSGAPVELSTSNPPQRRAAVNGPRSSVPDASAAAGLDGRRRPLLRSSPRSAPTWSRPAPSRCGSSTSTASCWPVVLMTMGALGDRHRPPPAAAVRRGRLRRGLACSRPARSPPRR